MMRFKEILTAWLLGDQLKELAEAKRTQEEKLELEVNRRVAEIMGKMDPFEPFLKKYNVIFSDDWERPEEKLDSPSQIRLFMWAYGTHGSPEFQHLMDWIRNTQGNATLRKAKTENEWFYGRAAIATITLLIEEIRRLSAHYEEIMEQKSQTFDEHLAVE